MKNSIVSKCRAMLKSNPAMRNLLFTVLILFGAQVSVLHAQASLSIQGILKKSNGVAVEDGVYNITFRLYTEPVGGTVLWTEAQTGIEVTSGIYSTILGNSVDLDVPFNEIYYLGVTIGSSELTPRIQLTSAPYALSLIGSSNQFPSSGLVEADSIEVGGGVLARGGAPGLNGVSHNGYAFKGNSGDKDSGLFSTSDGKVSMYVNNAEVLAATPGSVAVTGNAAVSGSVSTSNLTLPNGGKITYDGKSDWRLVVDDNLLGGPNDWQVYNPTGGEHIGWNNPSSAGAAPIGGSSSNFAGLYLYPSDNNQVLKKFYNLSGVGDFTFIKVKFKYYAIDTWGTDLHDRAFAAFADGANGSQMRVCWSYFPQYLNHSPELNTNAFLQANDFTGNGLLNNSDHSINAEMTSFKSGNSFWLYFGTSVEEATVNERYAVGMIEIWVR